MSSEIIELQKEEYRRIIAKITLTLKRGGVVIHPTDTCYGMAADIMNPVAINHVYQLKKRQADRPISIIVSDFDEFSQYGRFYPIIKKISDKYCAYQFSFVVPRLKNLSKALNPGIDTVSIQIPKMQLSRDLLASICSPVTATSANISGRTDCYSADDVRKQFESVKVDFPVLIVDGGQIPAKKPSTVIKIINSKDFQILRAGDAGDISI